MADKQHPRRALGDGQGRFALVEGTKVGGYTTHFLASGGMSVVYKGVKDGETYALKEVDANNTKEVPSLLSEKSLLERLNHPGLVGYHDLFQEAGFYYLVVEYIDGKALADFLRTDNRANMESVFSWGEQLCAVFSYLHTQNPPVIYRDLKCENVLVADGKITLIDFGIARVHKGDRENDTDLMGSAATASPEHYGGAETDARSDIFTVGATLYDLISGGKRKRLGPFQFAPLEEFSSEVSPALGSVILKALSFKPEERQQSAKELAEELRWARDCPKGKPKSGEARGQRPLMLALVLCCLLAVGGLAWSKFTKQPQGLTGEIFTVENAVLEFGDELGLMMLSTEKPELVAKRLNELFNSSCESCGLMALEPEDIRVGRNSKDGRIVVFYAHRETDGEISRGPEALATVDHDLALELKVSEHFVAAYWRDLLRDTVTLSRGKMMKTYEIDQLSLGTTLGLPFSASFKNPEGGTRSAREVAVGMEQDLTSLKINPAELYKRVPERRRPTRDDFENIEGYVALRN